MIYLICVIAAIGIIYERRSKSKEERVLNKLFESAKKEDSED